MSQHGKVLLIPPLPAQSCWEDAVVVVVVVVVVIIIITLVIVIIISLLPFLSY